MLNKYDFAEKLIRLGQNLKKIREARGKNVDEVAEALGLSISLYKKLEGGKYTSVELTDLFHLADYFTVPLDLFVAKDEVKMNTFFNQVVNMQLTQKALESINNAHTRRRLMDVLNVTEFSISRYMQKNSPKLTQAAALEVIREVTRLPDNELLEAGTKNTKGKNKV